MCRAALAAYQGLTKGKGEGDPLVWDALYTAMCSDILEKQLASTNTNFIISQAVYTRRSRDMVKELLGPNITFLIMDMDKELQMDRMVERQEGEGGTSYPRAMYERLTQLARGSRQGRRGRRG